jgi:hypothetical protein
MPVTSRLHFRTEIENVDLAETTGLVVRDTTTFPNGRVRQRTMTAPGGVGSMEALGRRHAGRVARMVIHLKRE